MIVMKFDAAALGSHDRLRALATLVARHKARKPVVVTSALPRVTDLLLEAADLAAARESEYEDRVLEVKTLHEQVAQDLLPDGPARRRLSAHLQELLEELRILYGAAYALSELTPRTRDAVAAVGERLSSELVAEALARHGLRAQTIDPRTVIVTDDAFGQAAPLLDEIGPRLGLKLKPMLGTGLIPVIGGYVGATREGVTTTLGRGGADGTAAVVGALLEAEEVQIWTEVDGLMTVDPKLAPDARAIPRVSPEEAAELAYFGSKVLHPAMIRPAVEKGIPVRVCNTREPDAPGTLITTSADPGPSGPCAVAFRKGITVVLISQPKMLMATGFLRQVFEIFERHATPIDLIATSEVSISVTVDDVVHLAEIKADLARLGEVRVLRETAIISLVGRGFFRYQGLARRIFEALSDVNVVMISFAASDANISVVVEEADTERAVHGLHREFFWKSSAGPAAEEKSPSQAAGGRKNPKSTSLPR
ncbi:MAG TPA: aspartate kinase [Vicinamibacteria bacterium]|nr:aspartate kinase [Vicinamibacteria bacterium]